MTEAKQADDKPTAAEKKEPVAGTKTDGDTTGKPAPKTAKSPRKTTDTPSKPAKKDPEYPRDESSDHYTAIADIGATGVATIGLRPIGYVGPNPLEIPEDRVDEVIKLLQKVKP
jgi:hypothetical protein